MARPCEKQHATSPESCRLCWLYENDPEYRRLWNGRPHKPRASIGELAARKRH